MRCSRADDRLHPPACQTVPRVVMPPLSHILCARPPPPAKSKATLGSLSTAAITSGDASCELDYANNAPPSHSRDCERTWMGAGTDKTLHDRSQTPESAARRKRTGAPSEHFFLFLSLTKKRCKDDGMQKTVPIPHSDNWRAPYGHTVLVAPMYLWVSAWFKHQTRLSEFLFTMEFSTLSLTFDAAGNLTSWPSEQTAGLYTTSRPGRLASPDSSVLPTLAFTH
jgi:hypothetical protein